MKSQIRFHVDTLIGQINEDGTLPLPASDDDKASWMQDCHLQDTLDADAATNITTENPSSSNPSHDPKFPYENGPGHADSTPQQLYIMWKMMNNVGVKRFRPDFAQSQKTGENKWLWEVAHHIFLRLVSCGEYPGVSAEPQNE